MRLISTIAMLLVVAACASPGQFIDSTAKFATATVTLTDAAESYFEASNRTEFELHLARAEYKPKTKLKPDAIIQTLFCGASLSGTCPAFQARKAALATLRQFATALSKAAGGKIGDDFKSAVKGLQGQIDETVKKIAAMPGTGALKSIGRASGPLSTLAGTIGKMVIDQMQANAIINAILKGEKPIALISDAIGKDMEVVLADADNSALGMYRFSADGFNKGIPSGNKARSQKDRSAAIKVVRKSADAYFKQRGTTAAFKRTLKIFNKAMANMVAFAKAKRDPAKLPDLVASVELLSARAKALYKAVEEVRVAFQR